MPGTFVDTDGNTKANQPGDNVGVQYGLKSLQGGVINDLQAASLFDATIDGVSRPYYIRSGSALGSTQGAGPKASIDRTLDSKVSCTAQGGRPFVLIGTWSTVLP